MSTSRRKVISWITVLTSDGWEVKLGLAVREDEEVMLPWLLPIPPVPDSPGGGLCELIASSLAGNGFVVTGEHSQEKTGFFFSSWNPTRMESGRDVLEFDYFNHSSRQNFNLTADIPVICLL